MPTPCNPTSLLSAAACFPCLTPKQLQAVKSALACSWVNKPAPVTGMVVTDLTFFSSPASQASYTTAAYQPSPNALVLAFVVASISPPPASAPVSFTGNGLTWVLVKSTAYGNKGGWNASLWRAMGAVPTNTAGTVSFGGFAQASCAIAVLQIANVDTTGTNGSGAIVQSVSNQASGPLAVATMAALNPSGKDAAFGFSGNLTNPYGGTKEAGWTLDLNNGAGGGATQLGAFISYQLNSLDNTISVSQAPQGWGVIGIEVKAP